VRCFMSAVVALAGVMGGERAARAEGSGDGAAACIDTYEEAQERRLQGALLEAREGFAACSSEACPAFIHSDCTRFFDEVVLEIPSVSFEVTSGNRRLSEVRVMDGERVLGRVSGAPLELDPGVHTLRFEASGAEAVTRSIVIERGEKNNLVQIDLPPLAPSPPPRGRAGERRGAVQTPIERPVHPAPWVALGVGAAGVASFAFLGASGRAEERRLEKSCAPRCRDAQLQSVKTTYLVADISLGVGVSGVLVGGYLLLTRDPEPAAKAGALPVVVHAGRDGGGATLRGSF
jgi:hypothetical protein